MIAERAAAGLEVVEISYEADLLRVRTVLRRLAVANGFGIVDQTKLITAGSEIARNILKYASGANGRMSACAVHSGERVGLRAVFSDEGPGIADVTAALGDGFSSGGTLGLGLPGARRLVDEFDIETSAEGGTCVSLTKWKT